MQPYIIAEHMGINSYSGAFIIKIQPEPFPGIFRRHSHLIYAYVMIIRREPPHKMAFKFRILFQQTEQKLFLRHRGLGRRGEF